MSGRGELVLTVGGENHGTQIIRKLMRSGVWWEEIEGCGFPEACSSGTAPHLFTCSLRSPSAIILECFLSFLCTAQSHIPLSSFQICVLLAEYWIRRRDGKDSWKCFPACCLLPVIVGSSVQKFLHRAACAITTFGFVFAWPGPILIVAVCCIVDNFILESASCFSWNECQPRQKCSP